ncbi:MAG: hypothetical protein IPK31_16015 [Chitinophagaceae bacterium]|nr:hypothetical protein [Chitinophagaceae bacterium]
MEMTTASGGLIQLLFLFLLLVPAVLYLITLQRTLQVISSENRRIPPGQVWLLLIPLFNLVWQFVVVNKLAHSIRLECMRLNIPTKQEKPTFDLGNIQSILLIIGFMPVIGILFTFCGFICWIIYWVQVAGWRKKIIANQGNDLLDAERELLNQQVNKL